MKSLCMLILVTRGSNCDWFLSPDVQRAVVRNGGGMAVSDIGVDNDSVRKGLNQQRLFLRSACSIARSGVAAAKWGQGGNIK